MIPNSIQGSNVVFVLYECDVGVQRNGGRPGARQGPGRFLEFLNKMGSLQNPEYKVDFLSKNDESSLKVSYCYVDLHGTGMDHDLDDSSSSSGDHHDPLVKAHDRLTETVQAVLEAGGVPFCIGGGNDQSYANWRALRQFLDNNKKQKQQHQQQQQQQIEPKDDNSMAAATTTTTTKIGVINIDAHLDVRPMDDTPKTPNSGTPFRQILQDDSENTMLWEFAAQGSQCSQEHADFVTQHGGHILWLDQVRDHAAAEFQTILLNQQQQQQTGIHNTFVSFDLDSIKAADCPGVSCPSNTGLTAEDALQIMRIAGAAPNVQLVDMSELNPVIEDYITPRLAVQMAYHFLLGYAQRIKRTSSQKSYRLRISNLNQLVCVEDVQKQGFRTGEHMSKLNIIENGTILVDQDGCIAYVGPAEQAPETNDDQVDVEMDGHGKSAIPGLCDAHTHAVWAGDRVHEFALKLAGATYMDIHNMGGGINFTVKATREADEESLYQTLVERLYRMNATGTTLVECKSGYGLETATELKMLRVIDRAHQNLPFVDLVGNFCGGHSIPDGTSEEEALENVVQNMIPALAAEQAQERLLSTKLVDVFAEDGVFSIRSAEQILQGGARIGLLGNFHGDELSYQASGELAARLRCRAVSHLEHVSDCAIAAMKESQTAAVVLPTTSFVLRIKPPPTRKLIDGGVPVALGTDFNPNAHCSSMPNVMNLACIVMKMTVEEALVASTLNAAYSMGMQNTHGSLEIGKRGDIVLVNESRWEHVIYQFGGMAPLYAVVKDGIPRYLN